MFDKDAATFRLQRLRSECAMLDAVRPTLRTQLERRNNARRRPVVMQEIIALVARLGKIEVEK